MTNAIALANELGLCFNDKGNRKQWLVHYRGKTRYVAGAVAADKAVELYHQKRPTWDAQQDKTQPLPEVVTNDVPVGYLGDAILTSKKAKIRSDFSKDGITEMTYIDYETAIKDFVAVVGYSTLVARLTPDDFRKHRQFLEKKYGLFGQRKMMVCVRSMFKFGLPGKQGIIATLPKFGDEYTLPKKKAFRIAEAMREMEHGVLAFTPDELAKLWAGTWCGRRENARYERSQRARILMALNAGYGNEDIADFPLALAKKLVANRDKTDIVDYIRAKNGVRRKAPFWPETIDAIAEVLADRRIPSDLAAADLLFVTKHGNPYIVRRGKQHKDRIAAEFGKLNERAGIKTFGRNFYSLRRTHRTYSDEMKDQRAAALVAGHETNDIAALYVEWIKKERLYAITDHIRNTVALPMMAAADKIKAERPAYEYPKPSNKEWRRKRAAKQVAAAAAQQQRIKIAG